MLERVYLENDFYTIQDQAFSRCGHLQKIYIPKNVPHIGENAFADCPELTAVVQKGSYAENYCRGKNIPFVAHTEKVKPLPFFYLD